MGKEPGTSFKKCLGYSMEAQCRITYKCIIPLLSSAGN